MPTSAKQRAANRRNANHSTGPKTPAGKAASSRNAITHGILSRQAVVTDGLFPESEDEFLTHLQGVRASFVPATPMEDLLCQQLAVAYWKLARLTRVDAAAIGAIGGTPARRHVTVEVDGETQSRLEIDSDARHFLPITFPNLTRYERTIQHTIDRTLAHLVELQALRRTKDLPGEVGIPAFNGVVYPTPARDDVALAGRQSGELPTLPPAPPVDPIRTMQNTIGREPTGRERQNLPVRNEPIWSATRGALVECPKALEGAAHHVERNEPISATPAGSPAETAATDQHAEDGSHHTDPTSHITQFSWVEPRSSVRPPAYVSGAAHAHESW
jgi:hypothetical protein